MVFAQSVPVTAVALCENLVNSTPCTFCYGVIRCIIFSCKINAKPIGSIYTAGRRMNDLAVCISFAGVNLIAERIVHSAIVAYLPCGIIHHDIVVLDVLPCGNCSAALCPVIELRVIVCRFSVAHAGELLTLQLAVVQSVSLSSLRDQCFQIILTAISAGNVTQTFLDLRVVDIAFQQPVVLVQHILQPADFHVAFFRSVLAGCVPFDPVLLITVFHLACKDVQVGVVLVLVLIQPCILANVFTIIVELLTIRELAVVVLCSIKSISDFGSLIADFRYILL